MRKKFPVFSLFQRSWRFSARAKLSNLRVVGCLFLPDGRAEIADMLIRIGFWYLELMVGNSLTLSHQRTMKEVVDFSKFLLQTIGGEPYVRVPDHLRAS
jgi:hypothetical protein